LWKLVTVRQAQLTADDLLLTRSLAFTPVEATRTSPFLGVVAGPLGRGIASFTAVTAFVTDLRALLISETGPTVRASTPVGVAMTPARRVARNEERKILACILNKKGNLRTKRIQEVNVEAVTDNQRT